MTQNEVLTNKPTVISRRISIIYHKIFVDDPYSLSEKKSEFWDEFFMLKPRAKELQLLLKNCDAEILHFLTLKCIQYIKLPEDGAETTGKENNKREELRKRPGNLQINTVSSWDAARIGNAYTTLSILIESTCHYPDFISLLFGCCSVVDDPKENKLRLFITHLQEILGKNISIDENIRECALLCMVSCVTCLKTQVNPFLEHFFKTPLVENLLQLLVAQRYVHGRLIITFLSSLILHKDFYDQGSCNPYQVQISLCESQPQLVAITAHIMQRLQHAIHRFLNYDELIKQSKLGKNNVNSDNSTQINEQITGQITEQQISDSRKTSTESFNNLITNTKKQTDDLSRTSSLTTPQLTSQQLDQTASSPANGVFSWIGKLLFSPENDSAKQNKGKLKLSSKGYDIYSEALEVLFLHESVQLNRHFIPIIALCSPDRFQFKEGELLSPVDPVETTTVIGNSSEKRANYFIPDTCALSVFIEYTSIVMQNTRGILSSNPIKDNSSNLVAICFNVLALIVQDMYACSFLFDQKNQFSLSIYKTPMRHRKLSFGDKEDKSGNNNGIDSTDSQSNSRSKPLACWVLELCLEFMVSNLTKINFPLDIYSRVINVIHRLLIHQKRLGQRLPMAFSHLWHALVVLLKFITNNERQLQNQGCEVEHLIILARQAVNIFNIFITFGDAFLGSPEQYDRLYYELIRLSAVFDSLNSFAERHESSEEGAENEDSLGKSLTNIRDIGKHFTPKISEYMTTHQVPSLTEQQVFEVVRNNYGSLELSLNDSLDVVDPMSTICGEQKEQIMFDDINKKSRDSLRRELLKNLGL